MLTLVRRYLVLAGLMFWQGGFTFYASVVVFAAQRQIGHRRQGFITADVTTDLNLAGAVALAVFAWDLLAGRRRATWQRRGLEICWLGMLACLGALVVMHRSLADMLLREGWRLSDPAAFRPLHRWYLWVSTVQWGFALLYTGLVLAAWQSEDRAAASASFSREPAFENKR